MSQKSLSVPVGIQGQMSCPPPAWSSPQNCVGLQPPIPSTAGMGRGAVCKLGEGTLEEQLVVLASPGMSDTASQGAVRPAEGSEDPP